MQGVSTYMAPLVSGNIHVLYGGSTAVSRAIATGGFDLAVIATETRYVPLRMMVNPGIQSPVDLRGKKLGVGRAGLNESATILYLEKLGLAPGKDVQFLYLAGGIPSHDQRLPRALQSASDQEPRRQTVSRSVFRAESGGAFDVREKRTEPAVRLCQNVIVRQSRRILLFLKPWKSRCFASLSLTSRLFVSM